MKLPACPSINTDAHRRGVATAEGVGLLTR